MKAVLEKIDLNNLDKSTWEPFLFEEITNRVTEGVDPNTTALKKYVGLEHIDAEDIHIKRFGTPSDVSGGKLKCYPGDVIFGKRRAYQRKAAIVDFEGICSAHAFVFKANPKVIDPKLFPFFLHSDQFMHRAVDISVGGLSPTINWGDLKGQEFLLPPKAAQARLAELLWAMDDVVEKEKGVFDTLHNIIKKSIESSILGRQTNQKNKFEKKEGFIPSKLPSIPIEWEYRLLSDFIWFQEGPGVRTTQFRDEGVKLLNGTNINENILSLESTNRHISNDEAFGAYSHFLCDIGDLVIACSGITVDTFDKKIAYVKEEHLPLCMNTSTMRFKATSDKIKIEYFRYFLMSNLFKFQIQRLITGSAQLNFGPTHMEKIFIPFPTSTEQTEIIKILSDLELTLSKLELKSFDISIFTKKPHQPNILSMGFKELYSAEHYIIHQLSGVNLNRSRYNL